MRGPKHSDRGTERAKLIEEARAVGADPVDRAEMRAVMEDMEAVSADWPDDGAPADSDTGALDTHVRAHEGEQDD